MRVDQQNRTKADAMLKQAKRNTMHQTEQVFSCATVIYHGDWRYTYGEEQNERRR